MLPNFVFCTMRMQGWENQSGRLGKISFGKLQFNEGWGGIRWKGKSMWIIGAAHSKAPLWKKHGICDDREAQNEERMMEAEAERMTRCPTLQEFGLLIPNGHSHIHSTHWLFILHKCFAGCDGKFYTRTWLGPSAQISGQTLIHYSDVSVKVFFWMRLIIQWVDSE